MKSLTGKFTSVRGWALLLALLLGAGLMISACGDEEVPTPTTPAPTPAPTPTPTPTPEPEPTGPATPANLRVLGTGSNYIEWTWDAVEGVLGYQGQFSTDAVFTDADQTFLIIAPQTSHRISNLQGSTTGYFRVQSGAGTSLASLQYSDWSAASSGTTAAPPAPAPATALSAPTGFSATNREDNSITLSWSAVDDADTYEVGQREGSGSWGSASCGGDDNEVTDTGCVASGLDEATEYDFRVRAVPASDDDTLATSSWTELDDAVSTTGTPPPMTISGAEDDLNVIWESDANSITFFWDHVDARDRDFLVVVLENEPATPISADDPCPNTPGAEVDPGTWIDLKSATRYGISDLSAGAVRGLCVLTTWLDDGGSRRHGNLSRAWAGTSPEFAVNENDTLTNAMLKTTEIRWGVRLDQTFEYPVRVMSVSPEDPTTALDPEDCSDITGTSKLGPTNRLTIAEPHVLKNPTAFKKYAICAQTKNGDGASDWVVSLPLSTRPGKPSLTYSRETTDDEGKVEALVWSIRDHASLPESETLYSAAGYSSGKSLKAADRILKCNDQLTEDAPAFTTAIEQNLSSPFTPLTSAIEVEYSGLTAHPVVTDDAKVPPTTTTTTYFYLCVRAHLPASTVNSSDSGTNFGPWGIAEKSIVNTKLPS